MPSPMTAQQPDHPRGPSRRHRSTAARPHLGFMFFRPESPRNLEPRPPAGWVEPSRSEQDLRGPRSIPTDAELDVIAATAHPDLIQLQGGEDPGRVRAIAERTGAGVIKALPVSERSDLDAAQAFDGVADHLMFDAKPPKDAARPGGLGARFDWDLLTGRRFTRPWFLAGGLDPWNVTEAVAASGAPIVDVSSGVERGPGLKDPALISAFLEAGRRASRKGAAARPAQGLLALSSSQNHRFALYVADAQWPVRGLGRPLRRRNPDAAGAGAGARIHRRQG